MAQFQYAELPADPHEAAGELMTRVEEKVREAAHRYNQTAELHRSKAISLETALESLREIQEHAAWATRMLIEVTGAYRRDVGQDASTMSMRRVAAASGVSLASIHQWVTYPAQVIDGRSGPGTLPKPGQTNHFHAKRTDGSTSSSIDPEGVDPDDF